MLNRSVMAKSLLTNTSTLAVKLPDYLSLPVSNHKIRTEKSIIKTTIRLLQSRVLELRYIGWKPSETKRYFDPIADSDQTTVIAINVIESSGKICDFDTTAEKLLKRFKMELAYNNEHIVIDHTEATNGKNLRLIEIYMTSRHSPKSRAAQYGYQPVESRWHGRV